MTGKSESSPEFKAQELKSVTLLLFSNRERDTDNHKLGNTFYAYETPILKTSKCDNQIHNAFQFYIQV